MQYMITIDQTIPHTHTYTHTHTHTHTWLCTTCYVLVVCLLYCIVFDPVEFNYSQIHATYSMVVPNPLCEVNAPIDDNWAKLVPARDKMDSWMMKKTMRLCSQPFITTRYSLTQNVALQLFDTLKLTHAISCMYQLSLFWWINSEMKTWTNYV